MRESGQDPHEGLGLPAEESGFDPTGHESWVTKRINGLEPTALSSLASVAARPWGPDGLRLEDAGRPTGRGAGLSRRKPASGVGKGRKAGQWRTGSLKARYAGS